MNGPRAPGWPHFADDEIAAVESVLRSGKVNYWTGDQGRLFEQEFAAYVGVEHGIALANGTLALELALRAIGIGPGDEVIVTPRTFIASASSVVTCGATPVFADIDRDSQNITAAAIATQITPRTRAIIAVHLAGWPCDMDPILDLAAAHGLRVIEDCAQAHGARYRGHPVGSFGDLAAFSFCQDKIMTTGGEGGMLITASDELWDRAWSYKDHGKSQRAMSRPQHPEDGPFRWVHESFGSNFRMTEMQAAIGRVQLGKLDEWVAIRRRNAAILAKGLADVPALYIPQPPEHVDHAFYKFYAFVVPSRLGDGWSRNRLMDELNRRGVPCFGGSCSEVYRERAFVDAKLNPQMRLPVARELGDSSIMFLVHPTLSAEDMLGMLDVIRSTLDEAMSN